MKEKLFQVFVCIYIFWQPILSSVLSWVGLDLDGSFMRMALVTIFVIALFFYIIIGPRYSGEKTTIIILVLFGLAFYSTHYFYNDKYAYELYYGAILRWGADCIPACLIGITLCKLNDFALIHKILPYESIALTPLMIINIVMGAALGLGQYIGEGGFDYQNLAYYMAFLFSFSFYYSFISSNSPSSAIKMLLILVMIVQVVGCLMSGGRGGVVLIFVYLLYLSYLFIKKNGSFVKIAFKAFLIFFLFAIISNLLNLQKSAGFERSSSLLQDKDRFDLWKSCWHFVEDNSYWGYGLGGDFYTFGFYTHNIFLDFMLETGIIGTVVLLIIFIKMIKSLIKLTAYNEIFAIVMLLFISSLVKNMFSGYWINEASLWLAFGIFMVNKGYIRKHMKKCNVI